MDIGMKVYYDLETGYVIVNTGERSGDWTETTIERDFLIYKSLSERVPETVGLVKLQFGAYAADLTEGGIINRIDLETLEPLFTYPDQTDPETPQEPRPALSQRVDQLAAESNANQLALMELHMMLLGEMPDAE